MIKRVITCILAILFVVTITPDHLNAMENDLPDCVVITHCVREDFEVRDLENAFQKATKIVSETARTKIVEDIMKNVGLYRMVRYEYTYWSQLYFKNSKHNPHQHSRKIDDELRKS